MLLSNAYLAQAPADYIDGAFRPLSGDAITTRDPANPAGVVWAGSPVAAHAEDAVAAARRALPAWSALSLDARRAYLERWRETCVKHAGRLAAAISREIGKVKWEAELEAIGAPHDAVVGFTPLPESKSSRRRGVKKG